VRVNFPVADLNRYHLTAMGAGHAGDLAVPTDQCHFLSFMDDGAACSAGQRNPFLTLLIGKTVVESWPTDGSILYEEGNSHSTVRFMVSP